MSVASELLYSKFFVGHSPYVMFRKTTHAVGPLNPANRRPVMHQLIILLVAISALSGCATSQQKFERRKQEKYSTYSSLTPEQRAAVDQRRIEVGLPMDAVYIAFGKPDQVINSGSEAGTFTTWLYLGVYLQSYLTSGWGGYYGGFSAGPYGGFYAAPAISYYPINYVSAEVKFQNGAVTSWRTSPKTSR
jgi:hypothetical protein